MPEPVEPVPETLDPVSETLDPVSETLDPVPETLEPVLETLEPVPAPQVTNLIDSLIDRVRNTDPALADDLRQAINTVTADREFGLVFNPHLPETVELPGRTVRARDKVRVKDATDGRTWRVARVRRVDGGRMAELVSADAAADTATIPLTNLVVVADFKDPIYPGLNSTHHIDRGEGKPTQVVINAENYHALEALTFAYGEKVDLIYIDPPYNTGGKSSWLYNDRFVDSVDRDKSAKWLSFMERRLRIAKRLLKPSGAIMVSIGDDEQHRLRMLMDQVFGTGNCVAVLTVEMSTTMGPKTTNAQQGTIVKNSEFVLIYRKSQAFDAVRHTPLLDGIVEYDINYSLWLHDDGSIGSLSTAMMSEPSVSEDIKKFGMTARNGTFNLRQMDKLLAVSDAARGFVESNLERIARGAIPPVSAAQEKVPFGRWVEFNAPDRTYILTSLSTGTLQQILRLSYSYRMTDDYRPRFGRAVIRGDLWKGFYRDMVHIGTEGAVAFNNGKKPVRLIKQLLRWANNSPDAVILDFFAGSGTTAHAVMEMNAEDDGRRQCLLITNNEVSRVTQSKLVKDGFRKGDLEWEAMGVYRSVTRPRIETVVTGIAPNGSRYSDGLAENVEFFDLTYEDTEAVRLDLAFDAVAPLLWLRAGGQGSRINSRTDTFAIADRYGVLFDPDHWRAFVASLRKIEGLRCVYAVTDDDNVYQQVAQKLPATVGERPLDVVRLYEKYLNNFEINSGRGI